MAAYGFKLLEIQLRRGNGRTSLDFGAPDGEKKPPRHYLDLVVADFGVTPEVEAVVEAEAAEAAQNDDLEQVGTVEIGSDDVVAEDPDDETPGEGSKQLAVVRIESAQRYKGAALLYTVYGLVGDHALAVDPSGVQADTDLKKLATTRHYRALIIAPESGKNGFLAVEVVSRSHAGSRLASRLLAGAKGHNYKIKTFGAVADDDAVRDLANATRISKVTLFQTVPSEDSARPRTIPAQLTFTIGKGSPEEVKLKDFVKRWIPTLANKKREAKDQPIPREEAKELATWLWPKLGKEVDFETAEVVVTGHHRPKRLRPLDMAEGFTYDMGNDRPDDDTFIAHVADVVNVIAATQQVDLSDDWTEPVAQAATRVTPPVK